MLVSVVIPVFDEEKNVEELHKVLSGVLKKNKLKYEILFIDDGSRDKTYSVLKKLRKKDKCVKLIKFRANFGKAYALQVGFKRVKGEYVFTMDGDLQDDPKEIPNFLKKMKEGYDLVSGWKFRRHDPMGKTLPSKLFNWLTSYMTGVNIHDSNCGFKCYRQEVVKNIEIYGELHRNIPALAKWKGYKIGEIKVQHHPRKHGVSKYGIERLLKGFLDLMTVKYLMTYNNRPLHFFGVIGLVAASVGTILGFYLYWLWSFGEPMSHHMPMMLLSVLLIVLGVQVTSIGLIGEMIVSGREKQDLKVLIKEEILT